MATSESQLANGVLMIRPQRFVSNPETAPSNRFQGKTAATADEQQASALRQFEALAAALRENGIDVVTVDDTAEPHTPRLDLSEQLGQFPRRRTRRALPDGG